AAARLQRWLNAEAAPTADFRTSEATVVVSTARITAFARLISGAMRGCARTRPTQASIAEPRVREIVQVSSASAASKSKTSTARERISAAPERLFDAISRIRSSGVIDNTIHWMRRPVYATNLDDTK